ncbi:MAG: hypothetical protein EPO26_16165 [Chloroflexota bacterium]|nr:MAG: hypothetical protein EPO26_16165 [Chloroflexota bacterium]
MSGAEPARPTFDVARGTLLAAIAVAAAARLIGLDAQSLWYDEGTTAALATRSIPEIIRAAAADIHPPLYYVLVSLWSAVSGTSEYALRLPSAFFGVVTVAGSAWLARKAQSETGGIAAAILVGLSPLTIWYGQEARMYALAAMLGVLSATALTRAIDGGSRSGSAWFAMLSVFNLYASYVAAVLPVAQGLGAIAARSRSGSVRTVVGVVVSGSAVAAAFAPWLFVAGRQLSEWPAQSEPIGLGAFSARVSGLFVSGPAFGQAPALLVLAVVAIATIAGARLVAGRSVVGLVVVFGCVGIPAALFVASLTRPFFHAKFVSLAAPFFDIALAVGIVAPMTFGRGRVRSALGAACIIVAVFLGVWRYSFVAVAARDPTLARDDYRGLVHWIGTRSVPGDAVVLNAPGQAEIFGYYYRGDLPVYPLPQTRPPDRAETESALTEIARRHGRVWLVSWASAESDPAAIVERWLDRGMFKATSDWFGGVRLSGYLNPDFIATPKRTIDTATSFDGVGVLERIEVADVGVKPGDVLPLTLTWVAQGSTSIALKTFVQLIDADDYLWGQRDTEPGSDARSTTIWSDGESIVDRVGVPVVAGTPPGTYDLIVGLYDPVNGRRVRTTSGIDHVRIGRVVILPYVGGPIGTPRRAIGRDIGSLRLVGVDLHPLGNDQAEPRVKAGQTLLLAMHWLARAPGTSVVSWRVSARRAEDREVKQWDIEFDRYPTVKWLPGEAVRVPKKLATDGLLSGIYRLTLTARDSSGDVVATVDDIGEVAID